jgi:hypothetical protein
VSTEGLGSTSEPSELTLVEQTAEVIPSTEIAEPSVTMASPPPAPSQDSELKQMIAGFMEAIQQGQLQESVRSEISSVKAYLTKNNEKLQESVRADLSTNSERFPRDC